MRRFVVLLLVLAFVAAACGGSSDDSPFGTDQSDSSETTTSQGEATDASSTTTGRDFDISQVETSVVKIASEGTFVDPEVGLQLNAAGVGSGFIISEDGIAVTNNHVVTGAALLRVFVPGQDEPVNAQILGVSECSDLAVIDLEGEGYQPLEFRTDELSTGVDVFSAGYPATDAATIEDVDFTLTRGIISTTTADGETNWASVDGVLEHDARIRGGNSGGPLVDENGRVVGINYAGNDQSDQNYAITAAEAEGVIATLRGGSDVDSLGINGQAVTDPEAGLSGVWVASVESGSPADDAGIAAGDIVTRLEGLVLATDGTLSDYCDIIRTQGSDDVLAVEVLRFDTGEVLEGQLNGTPLEPSFSFAQEFEEQVDEPTPDAALDTYAEYTSVSDDTGTISVDIPVEWSDTDGTENPTFGPSIWASPDQDSFLEDLTTPGVIVESSSERTAADIDTTLAEIDTDFSLGEVCTSQGQEPYEDALYTGVVEVWAECGDTGTLIFTLVATPEDGSFLIRALIIAVEARDLDAADRVFDSFVATGG